MQASCHNIAYAISTHLNFIVFNVSVDLLLGVSNTCMKDRLYGQGVSASYAIIRRTLHPGWRRLIYDAVRGACHTLETPGDEQRCCTDMGIKRSYKQNRRSMLSNRTPLSQYPSSDAAEAVFRYPHLPTPAFLHSPHLRQ
jgi:hypothetical protein